MKKAISILLVLVMCFGLCACSETESDGIKLTLDNYDDYLEFYAGVHGTQKKETDKDYWLGAYSSGYKFVHDDFYTAYYGSVGTEVVAPNFNFYNVTVKVRFTGKVLTILENSDHMSPTTVYHDIDFEDTFELNVGGTVKHKNAKIVNLPTNMLILSQLSDKYNGKYNIDINWEIVEISGTVKSAS